MTTPQRLGFGVTLAAILASSINVASVTAARRAHPAPAGKQAADPQGQTTTLLPDGRWLVLGGQSSGVVSRSAAVVDPATGKTTVLATAMTDARTGHTATMLPDGTVLIIGGRGALGQLVEVPELFDPDTGVFMPLAFEGSSARAGHSATLLTDGRVLVAGGIAVDGPVVGLEIWDVSAQRVQGAGQLLAARSGQAATLLADGRVELTGGFDPAGRPVKSSEIFDPVTGLTSRAALPTDDRMPARVAASMPSDGAVDVPTDARIAIRLSRPLRVTTITAETVRLGGDEGQVEAHVVPAEGGRLLFVTPRLALRDEARYTLSFDGVVDDTGRPLVASAISFVTAKASETASSSNDEEAWTPDAHSRETGWRTDRPASPWESLPPLMAPPGVTAISGRVLTLDGRPLAGVSLTIEGDAQIQSDRTGRFLLVLKTSVTTRRVLQIDGTSANKPNRHYGFFEYGMTVNAGTTNILPFTIWQPKLDTARQVTIPSPTTSEVVVTTPSIPGLELHLPAGTTIVGRDGKPATTVGITAIPVDRPPFPLAKNVDVPVYFTVQPGGAYVSTSGAGPKGAWLVYPNYRHARVGKRVQFFHYDPDALDWYVYGLGTVMPSGLQVMPDLRTRIYEFTGAMINSGQSPPTDAPPPSDCKCNGGDPVNLATGLFTLDATDLYLPDVMPIVLTRTYRQRDTDARVFGVGTTHPYAMFLWSAQQYQEADLILPDGGEIHYVRTSPGTGWTDAVFVHQETSTTSATPTRFYKSKMIWNGNGWNVTLKDGSVYVFGENAPLQAIRDRFGNQITIAHANGQSGNVTGVTSPNGRWIAFTYDDSNRVNQVKDNIGRTVTYTYDGAGNLATVTDPEGHITSYTYDADHQMLTVKSPSLQGTPTNLVTNEYTTAADSPTPPGWVKRQTHADGGVFNFAYTFTDGKISHTDLTDPMNIIRRVTFNPDGHILNDTRALGTVDQQIDATTRQSGTNFVTSVTRADGSQTSTTYDTLGNIASVTSHAGTPDAATTTYTYDPNFNQLATITDPLNHTTTMEFDEHGNQKSIIDALNHKTSYGFDASGRVTTITDPLQHAAHIEYSGPDIVAITDPLGRTKRLFVDGAGRTVKETDPAGAVTEYVYDKIDHVIQHIDPAGALTTYGYDRAGRLSTVTDALNHITSYAYDTMDRVVTRTDPMGGIETLIYDPNGNLAGRVDRKGQATAYDYDGLNRVSRITYADDSTVDYTYDALDRPTTITDSLNGSVTRTYDSRDRLASETTPLQTVSYTYDNADRRDTMTLAGQAPVTYGYDAADRPTTVTQNGATVAIAYDDANHRTVVTFPGGPQMEYTYDDASQLTGLAYRNASTTLGTLTYAYDLAGRRTEVGGSWARTVLPQPVASATYDAANRATSWGGVPLFYDRNGNLVTKGSQSFAWNSRDQLSGIIGTPTQTLTYDAAGRRATTVGAGTTTSFAYDRVNIVRQSTSGGTAIDRVVGTDVDDTFLETAGVTRALFVDALGSTIARVDAAGSVQQAFAYGPFGATIATGATEDGVARFTGREDEGNGLLAFRSRYYDPEMGRFISEDRVGVVGGANLYTYVDDDPVQQVDPFGTHPIWPPTWSTPDVPFGLKIRCNESDACALLTAKMAVYTGLISVHVAWDAAFWPGRHTKEINDFGNGFARCKGYWDEHCKCDPNIRPPTPEEVNHMERLFAFGATLTLLLRIVALFA